MGGSGLRRCRRGRRGPENVVSAAVVHQQLPFSRSNSHFPYPGLVRGTVSLETPVDRSVQVGERVIS